MNAFISAAMPRATMRPYGLLSSFHYDPDTDAAGNATATSSATPPATPPPVKKIELTEDELNSRVTAAVEAERRKHESDRKTERERNEAEAAKKSGEFEKLYNVEVEGRKADRAALRNALTSEKLTSYLSAKHPDYIASAKYIRPLIEAGDDTADDELLKRVGKSVEQFITDNPRPVSASGSPSPVRNKFTTSDPNPINNKGVLTIPRLTGAAANF